MTRSATSEPSLPGGGHGELGQRPHGPCGDLWAVAHAAGRHGELDQRLHSRRGDLWPRITPQASKTSSDSSTTARAATSGPSLTAGGPDELGRRLRGPCGDLQAVARAASRHGELGQRLPAPSRNGRRGLGQQLHGPRDDLRTAISQQAGRTSSASSSTTSGDFQAALTQQAVTASSASGSTTSGDQRAASHAAGRHAELAQQLHGPRGDLWAAPAPLPARPSPGRRSRNMLA